ncbi:hypothetical protein [Chryseobacterium potabilaquae]|uniref:Uncharacterized protein n=1 Tax=Chryseobacterium potabilaquae TaxID=2675057 RepID=A0A6N4X7X5_9FLAO|nr:hypothetical protein [Chryseobacterium potabilaquae]CAA7196847.1 hypothetical protein CHRY9293_02913 [Chryseobacterium potabilaquae]
MKKQSKKLLKRGLKLFIRIEIIPFNDNGKTVEYCTMYVFGLPLISNISQSK